MFDFLKEFNNIMSAFALVSSLGLCGMVFVIWIFDYRRDVRREKEWSADRVLHEERLAKMSEYQGDIIDQFKRNRDQIIAQFETWMGEMRQMYVNNAALVKRYDEHSGRVERLAEKAIETINLSNQVQSVMLTRIESNQFCPMVRKHTGQEDRES